MKMKGTTSNVLKGHRVARMTQAVFRPHTGTRQFQS